MGNTVVFIGVVILLLLYILARQYYKRAVISIYIIACIFGVISFLYWYADYSLLSAELFTDWPYQRKIKAAIAEKRNLPLTELFPDLPLHDKRVLITASSPKLSHLKADCFFPGAYLDNDFRRSHFNIPSARYRKMILFDNQQVYKVLEFSASSLCPSMEGCLPAETVALVPVVTAQGHSCYDVQSFMPPSRKE